MPTVGDEGVVGAPEDARSARGAATKERILREAARLFSLQGYDATSVESIADAAGVASASIYRHFPAKHAVLLAVADRATRTSHAARALKGAAELPTQLGDLFAEYMADGEIERRRLSIELSRAAYQSQDLAQSLAAYNKSLRASLAATIELKRPEFVSAPGEAAMLAHLFMVLLMGAIHVDTLEVDHIGNRQLVAYLRERFAVMLSDASPGIAGEGPAAAKLIWDADAADPVPEDGRRARTVRTKRRILNAAAELFAVSGYDSTTVEMVADKSGITVAGLYHHVDSKEQLLVEVARRAFTGYRLMRPLGDSDGVSADLAVLLAAFAGGAERVSRRLAVELDFGAWRSSELANSLYEFHRGVRADIAASLRREQVGVELERAQMAAMVVLMLFMGTAHLDTVDPSLVDDPRWVDCLRRRVPQLIG